MDGDLYIGVHTAPWVPGLVVVAQQYAVYLRVQECGSDGTPVCPVCAMWRGAADRTVARLEVEGFIATA